MPEPMLLPMLLPMPARVLPRDSPVRSGSICDHGGSMRARPCVPFLLVAALGSIYACEDSSAPTAFNPPPTTTPPDRDAGAERDAERPPVDASLIDAPVDAPPAAGPSGVLDLTFNSKGFITRIGSNGGTNEQADDIALDSMGRILVAGSSTGADVKAAVWRFTPAGAIDTTFGTGGVWLKSGSFVSATYEAASAIAIDAQDRPLVTGQSNNNSPYYMATWRLTTAGVLDTTLAGTGFYGATSTVGAGAYDYGAGITVDAAGNILVAGFSTVSASNIDLCVWRHSATGVLDTAGFAAPNGFFSEHGASNPTANPFDTANRVVIDGTGRIVLSATSFTGATTQGLVVRLTGAGAIDTTFNTTGLRLISGVAGVVGATAFDGTSGLAIDSAGRIVVGGSTVDAVGHYHAYVTRLTSAGAIDTTFGTSGFTILPSPKSANVTFGGRLAVDSKGRIVVVGSGDGNLAAWRLNANGALDASFGTAGTFTTTATASSTLGDGGTPVVDNATSVKIDSLDRALISGTSGNATNGFAMVVWRLTP
jgi:uncharacterized delta-60 repeat protein